MTVPIAEKQVEDGRKAWVTLLTRPSYLAGVLTLHRTLRAVSKYPLVLMVTSTLPRNNRDICMKHGLEMIDVDHISPKEGQHGGFDPTFIRLNDAWTKLAVFGLTDFERVILIDADMIFTRGMDDLFDLPLPGRDWIAASPACVCNPLKIAHYPPDWIPANCMIATQDRYETLTNPPIPHLDGPRTSHLLNSGLVVLHPSTEILSDLVHFLNTSPSIAASRFADQDVIAEAFKGRWQPLPWYCNALKSLRAVHPDVWADEEVRLIHYILDKPWAKRPETIPPTADMPSRAPTPSKASITLPSDLVDLVKNSSEQQSITAYPEVHLWWWVAYQALVGELKGSGDEETWQEMDKWIAQS